MTALIKAASRGHIKCLQLLMEGGADKEAKSNQGSTALILAACNGHTDCVRLLMVGGADKESKSNIGRTALIAAACNGFTDCTRLLMDSGANKEARANVRHAPRPHPRRRSDSARSALLCAQLGDLARQRWRSITGTARRQAPCAPRCRSRAVMPRRRGRLGRGRNSCERGCKPPRQLCCSAPAFRAVAR